MRSWLIFRITFPAMTEFLKIPLGAFWKQTLHMYNHVHIDVNLNCFVMHLFVCCSAWLWDYEPGIESLSERVEDITKLETDYAEKFSCSEPFQAGLNTHISYSLL